MCILSVSNALYVIDGRDIKVVNSTVIPQNYCNLYFYKLTQITEDYQLLKVRFIEWFDLYLHAY